MIRELRYLVLVAVWLAVAVVVTAQELRLTSPDGGHEVRFYQTTVADGVRELRYTISYRGAEVITDARAGDFAHWSSPRAGCIGSWPIR